MLKGRLEVVSEDNIYVLDEGDTIYLDLSKPHKIRNIGNSEAIAIWINSPPTW